MSVKTIHAAIAETSIQQKQIQHTMKKDNANAVAGGAAESTEMTQVNTNATLANTGNAVTLSTIFAGKKLTPEQVRFQNTMKATQVNELGSPSKLILNADGSENRNDGAVSEYFTLNDAFPFTMEEDGANGGKVDIEKVCFVIVTGDGELKTIIQSKNGSTSRYVKAFAEAQENGGKIAYTNCIFHRLTEGGQKGNKPVVLEQTADTAVLFTPFEKADSASF